MNAHSKVRWLSRGRVLTCLCDLREEVRLLLSEISSPLLKHMADMNWVTLSACLSGIFDRINSLNIPLSCGRVPCHFGTRSSLYGYGVCLCLTGLVEMFPTLEDVVEKGACLCSHNPMFPQLFIPTALCSHILLAAVDPASLQPQHLVGIELGLALTLSLTQP